MRPYCKKVTATGFMCGHGLPCPYHATPAPAPAEYPGPCARCGATADACACAGGESGPFRLTAREERLTRAAQRAIPWLVLLGDTIGNGTPADPDGRCAALADLHEALGADDVPNAYPARVPQ